VLICRDLCDLAVDGEGALLRTKLI